MAGFIRYKYDNLSEGNTVVTATILGNTYSKTIRVKPFCTGELLIKYLDHNGQYRFYSFNNRFKKKDTPKLIGSTNKLISELLTAQTNKKNIGYSNDRTITAYNDLVPQDELDLLADLYTSPRVYLLIGSGDELKDWIEVTVKSKDNQLKKSKGNFYTVEVEIILPSYYTVKML